VGPDIVVASSTSALLASDLQSESRHPERIVVGHPFNPPHLIPLVEVVGGSQTSAEVVAWTMDFYAHIEKYPVHVKKEAVGHIANRLTAALFREALYMVEAGIAEVADIDAVMTQGPGLRWASMGPFLTYHLAGGEGGIRHYMEHLGPTQESRWRTLGSPQLTPTLIETVVREVLAMVGETPIEELAQRRDEALIRQLLNAKAQRNGV
jgi:carnitine 3-dehydrogenase